MKTFAGFHGRYWRFDLGTGTGAYIPLDEAVLRRFLGGVGLGAWLLHRESPAGVDPLAPEAALVFAFSPLVGTPLTTSAKFAVVAKSPLTGMISDSLSSSHFAIHGKRMGVDAIVLVGACAQPSVLVDGALRPTDLWGRSSEEACAALAPYGTVAAIGVAGEHLVRYATISNDGRHAGRGGLGAVMGAKKLKAIVVRGEVRTELSDAPAVLAIAKDLSKRSFGPATAKYRELGTVGNLLAFNRLAALPTRNFQSGTFDQAAALSAEQLAPTRAKAKRSCASCTIGCEHIYAFGDAKSVRVEYENVFALGPLCGIGDPDAVLAASKRCDDLGLDTISAGGTIAFAMECAERGLIAGPRFGDAAGLMALLEDIAHRRGLGALLAEGSRRAAEAIGSGSIDFAPQVKGMELPGYEPRALQTMALGFAVGTRGADHNRSGAYELDFSDTVDRLKGSPEAARLAAGTEDRAALMDALILCKFLRGVFTDLYAESAAMLRAVTGWDVTAAELVATSARIVALKKAFNIREGWTPASDTLPKRFLSEGLPDGASKGALIPRERLQDMVRAYNRARGWTDDGWLPDTVYEELAL
ncbi:MAG: aldehyde ferredoxin oxidoreductase family protein [Planctomycetes bacterium]|nr:aldehyde ferredoxin oxidoreductase family protein [Planctomycetota bacterium]